MKKFITASLIFVFLICSFGISACKADDSVNNEKFVKLSNWVNRSPNPTNLIWVEYEDKNITCSIVCKRGKISKVDSSKENVGTTFSVNEKAKYTDSFWGTGRDYVSILLFKKNQVVGYALIEVTMLKDPEDLIPRILVEQEMETPISEEEAMDRIAQVEEVAREEYNSEKNTFLGLFNWRFTSGATPYVMEVDYDDDYVQCKYVCEKGALYGGNEDPSRLVEVGVYQEVRWTNFFLGEGYATEDKVSVYLMKNGQVIGYVAFEVKRNEESGGFNATILIEKLLQTPISEKEAIAIVETMYIKGSADVTAKNFTWEYQDTIDDTICDTTYTMTYHV